MIFPLQYVIVLIALIRFEASAVIIIMAVFLPFRTGLIDKVSDDAIGVPVLEVPQVAVDAVQASPLVGATAVVVIF